MAQMRKTLPTSIEQLRNQFGWHKKSSGTSSEGKTTKLKRWQWNTWNNFLFALGNGGGKVVSVLIVKAS